MSAPSPSQHPKPRFSREEKGKSTVSTTSKYTNSPTLFSRSNANRTHKTEAERAQGPRAKFSQLTKQGKAVLKQQASTPTPRVDLTTTPQPEEEFLLIGTLKVPISHIPHQPKQTSTISKPESSGSSSPTPSVSVHSSVSEGPAFKLPENYVSLLDLKALQDISTLSTPASQPTSKTPSENGKGHIKEDGVFGKNEMPASQRPSAAQHKHQPKVQATTQGPNNVSKVRVLAKNARTNEHTAKRENLPDVDRSRSTANRGSIPKADGIVRLVKNEAEVNINLLKSAADVKAVAIFPSRLSLKSQQKLASLLDSLHVAASTFLSDFIISRIKTDTLKAIQRNILISNTGKVHFFNNNGSYVGTVAVEEPVWFYGRLAGRNDPLYLSLGKGKTSKCFIKTRFPTLHEFLRHDWAEGKSSLKFVTVYDPVGKRNWLGSKAFCWLPLYLNNKVQLDQIPTSGLVRLFTLQDRFGLVPISKTGKYYHYSPEGKTHKKFPNVLVGAEGAVTEIVDATWNDCLSDPLLRTAVDSVLKKTVLKETSCFQTNIDDLFNKALNQTLDVTKSNKVTISQHLNSEEFELLKSYFGLTYVENGVQFRGAHPLLNAIRECYNRIYQKSFRGVTVSDIGGNLASVIFADAANTHVCLPLVDVKDAGRQTRSAIALLNGTDYRYDNSNLAAKRLQTLKKVSYCNKVVPLCTHKSSVITMVDVYDVPLKMLLAAMEAKGALLARLCFMYPPELINEDGVIAHTETGVVVRRDGNVVVYHIADTSDSYSHDVNNLLSYIKTSSIVSKRGFTYSVELLNQNGPYLDFQVSLSTATAVSASSRCFSAWLKNKTKVSIEKTDSAGVVHVERVILDRDFVRRILGYGANVCNTIDDRTYEYVLSNMRSQTTMMIVGSKIVHNKVELSTDVLVDLPGTFLKESVKRRRSAIDQAKKASRSPLRKVFDFLIGIPGKIFSKLLSLILGVLPKHYRSKLEKFLSEEELIKDCPDVVVTNTSVDNSKARLNNEILQDLLDVVKELTILNVPKAEIVEVSAADEDDSSVYLDDLELEEERTKKKEVKTRKAGLKGGGNNWYDFILPSKTKSADGESLLVDLWRIVRKLDRAVRGNFVMGPLMKALMFLLKGLVFVLRPAFHVVSGVKTTLRNSFSVKEEKKTLRKVISSFVIETLAKICNSLGLTYLKNLGSEVLSTVRSDMSLRIEKMEEDVDIFLKSKIASGLKALGLKYPKGWLDERHKLRVLFDAAWKAIKAYPLVPAAGCLLVLLLTSKSLREKVLKLPQEAFCFAERVRIGKPLVLFSALIGSLIGRYSTIASLFVGLESCRDMSLGMLIPSLIHSIPSLWDSDATGQKLALLLKFSVFYNYYGVYKTVFNVLDKEEPQIPVRDVADVEPGLEAFTLNADTEEVLENFRKNTRARLADRQPDRKASLEDTPSTSNFPANRKVEQVAANKVCSLKGSDSKVSVDDVTATEVKSQSQVIQTVEDSPSTSKGILIESDITPKLEESSVHTVVEPKNTDTSPSKVVPKRTDAPVSTIHLPEVREPLVFDGKSPDLSSIFTAEEEPSSETVPTVEVVESAPPVENIQNFSDVEDARLQCVCGDTMLMETFTPPGPLPLLMGDKLKGREAWFYSRGGESYSYTGGHHESRGWLDLLDKYLVACNHSPMDFDHCLVQLYGANCGIPFHSDNEPIYPKDNPILTVNVFGSANFKVSCKVGEGAVTLSGAKYFLMPNGFQRTHKHAVTATTERLSMTFRATKPLKLSVRRFVTSQTEDDSEDSPVVERAIRKSLVPEIKTDSHSFRPSSPKTLTVNKTASNAPLTTSMEAIIGVSFNQQEDFLNIEKFKNMKHKVTVDGNVGVVYEAFLYNLHELCRELSVVTKVLKQPDILVGRKRELFVASIPELNQIKVCKRPDLLKTTGLDSFVGSVDEKRLMFSNDPSLEEQSALIYLTPGGISFPLKRCLGLFKLMSALTAAEVDRALVGCKFINAVPGAGKTHEIKTLMKSYVDSKINSGLMLVLTSSKNAAESLNDYWDSHIKNKKVLVMTVDSFIFSCGRFITTDVDYVFIDECYMSHAGLCILIAAITNPSELSFYGDRRQVPFINRNPLFVDSRSMLDVKNHTYTEKLLTYRCPADICYWMSSVDFERKGGRLYQGRVTTPADGRPLKSVKSVNFSPSELSFFDNVDRVMTFTQMEKSDLISKYTAAGLGDRLRAMELIGTVAESQGETYSRVALVRTKAADDQVFESFPHRLVALTRHTQSLQFVCLPSKMSKGIGRDVQMIEKLEASIASTFVVQQHV
nr:methyl transferase/helicase [Grapevine leafroll-associated virus 4]